MDRANARDLRRLAPDDESAAKVRLLRSFDPDAVRTGDLEVPDPYYGEDGFARAFDLIERACRGLVADLAQKLGA
jgi:protein-tyrosine phosphatase